MKEDRLQIEAEAMEEILKALSFSFEGLPRGKIPCGALKPSQELSIAQTASMGTDSSEEEYFEQTKVEDGAKRISKCSMDFSGSGMNDSFTGRSPRSGINDSFMNQLDISIGSIESFSNNFSSVRRVNEIYEASGDDASILSHVSRLGTDDMVDTIHRLYSFLKKAEFDLKKEKKRRRSREKSLIKLAKELARRKDRVEDKESQLKELRECMKQLHEERDLLTDQVKNQKKIWSQLIAESRKELGKALLEARQVQECTVAEHEVRINQINRSHANQCEGLCREIVQANQEIKCLQKALAEASEGSNMLGRSILNNKTERLFPADFVTSARKKAGQASTCIALLCQVFWGYISRIHISFKSKVGQASTCISFSFMVLRKHFQNTLAEVSEGPNGRCVPIMVEGRFASSASTSARKRAGQASILIGLCGVLVSASERTRGGQTSICVAFAILLCHAFLGYTSQGHITNADPLPGQVGVLQYLTSIEQQVANHFNFFSLRDKVSTGLESAVSLVDQGNINSKSVSEKEYL